MHRRSVVAFLVALALGPLSGCGFQSIPQAINKVEAAVAEVTNQYKRRSDLIPNLVQTVKGYASHEKETLSAVIAARASATKITIDPSNATPEQIQAYQSAQGGLSQALGRLMMVSERYPDLKADRQFRELQAQLEGTENRIAVARTDYIEAVRRYNTQRRKFPTNFIAGAFGFDKLAQLQIDEGERETPEVKFDFGNDG